MRELEIKIIGTALMAEAEERARIFRTAAPEWFEEKDLSADYAAIMSAYEANPDADSLSYLSALALDRQRELVAAMNEQISPVIAAGQLPDTLNAFREAYLARLLKARVTDLAFGSPTAAELKALSEEMEGYSAQRTDAARDYLDRYTEPVRRIPTGFRSLDEMLDGGLIGGTLTTIGARPSTGKTTFALNIAAHDPTLKVLFVSIEMSARMIFDRLTSDKADMPYSDCIRHDVPLSLVRQTLGRYENLTVADDVSDAEDIAALIFAEKPDVAVIDYVQIVTTKRPFENNRQRIDDISRQLKTAAKKTGTAVISLSQITRAGKDKPTMSDLKESGGLEQDSDYVILLYREYVNDKSNAAVTPKPTVVTLDKNKFGRSGEIDMDFNGARQRFEEAADVITRPTAEAGEGNDDLPF